MSIKVHCDMSECINEGAVECGEQPAGWARILWVGGTKKSPQAEKLDAIKRTLSSAPPSISAFISGLGLSVDDSVKRRFQAYICPDCMGKLSLFSFQEVTDLHNC